MSLADCMNARGLGEHLRSGLAALGPDSTRVSVKQPGRVSHSVALDAALKARHPQAPRWDYGVAMFRHGASEIAWIEVHTATSGEVAGVLRKLAWLRQWLSAEQDACSTAAHTFHWVATDVGVHIDSARRRRLNAAGLAMPRTRLRL